MCVDRLYDIYGYNACREGVCGCRVLVVCACYFRVRVLLCRYACE